MEKTTNDASKPAQIIADTFVTARRNNQAVTAYPAEKPRDLADAYGVQDAAIDLWRTPPVGWKVGRIVGALADELGTDRLAGPVFEEYCWAQDDTPVALGVFNGGFAAVEGEVVVILGDDAPADKTTWTRQETIALIGSMHAGVEIASSPYAGINTDGPLVTITDFGNNRGLIIGDVLEDWPLMNLGDWTCRTFIDDALVGEATPAGIPGGPVESLRFLLENTARRGLPLKRGMAVCTGAVTGVHEIRIGQSARVEFVGARPIELRIEDATETDQRARIHTTAAE